MAVVAARWLMNKKDEHVDGLVEGGLQMGLRVARRFSMEESKFSTHDTEGELMCVLLNQGVSERCFDSKVY